MKHILKIATISAIFVAFALIGILFFGPTQGKMNTVRIEFEGIRYDSLELVFGLVDWSQVVIKGHSEDGYRWNFSYPGYFHEHLYCAWFRVLGTPDTVRHEVGFFNLVQQHDTLKTFGFIPGRPKSLIKARYIETQTSFNNPRFDPETENVIYITSIIDEFEIFTDDQDLISTMKAMHGGYFILDHETLSYEEIVQRQAEFIRQYPNSQIMMRTLYMNISGYKSSGDIAKLFNLFTRQLQRSFYGRKIRQHLAGCSTFINQKLTTWNTDLLEELVQDCSKYNLILFSASWCPPCTRQIPILKEIYRDLGQELIMTYVSLDCAGSAENWREKMRTHEIPWRSLMVLTREVEQKIRNDYSIRGVPAAILIQPNSTQMERLNLWEEKDRLRLYELVNE